MTQASANDAQAPVLAILDRGLARIELVTAWIGGLVIFLMMFLVTAEVVMRRLLASPIPGQVDITMLSMVAFGVLCVSFCYRRAGHIRMDLLVKVLRGRSRWSLELLVTLVAFVTISAILPGTWNHFLRAFEFGDTTFGVGLQTWPSKLAVPIGLGVLWLRLLVEFWVYGRLILRPDAAPIGVPTPPDPGEDMDA